MLQELKSGVVAAGTSAGPWWSPPLSSQDSNDRGHCSEGWAQQTALVPEVCAPRALGCASHLWRYTPQHPLPQNTRSGHTCPLLRHFSARRCLCVTLLSPCTGPQGLRDTPAWPGGSGTLWEVPLAGEQGHGDTWEGPCALLAAATPPASKTQT